MNILARISIVVGFGLALIATPLQSAPLFSVVSNGNTLTISTSSTTAVNAGIISDGFSFTNCTQYTKGYCRFTVTGGLPQEITIAGPARQPQLTICNFGTNNNPRNCQYITLSNRFAYVLNYLPLVNNVSNFSISLCPVDSTTGQLGTCTLYQDPTFNTVSPSGIALSPDGTTLYVTTGAYIGGQPNTISICPINSDGSFGNGTCIASPAEFYSPSSITINALGTLAYVPNAGIGSQRTGGNTISVCPRNSLGGPVTNCSTFQDISFNNPRDITFNDTRTLAYIPNLYPVGYPSQASDTFTVSKCSVNTQTGSLSSCVAMTDPAFEGPSSIALNDKGTFAYVTNYYKVTTGTFGTTVSLCPINTKQGGIFKACTTLSDPTFSGPIGIKLNATNTFAYITNYNSNQISICPVNLNGTLGACTAATSSILIKAPSDIVLF